MQLPFPSEGPIAQFTAQEQVLTRPPVQQEWPAGGQRQPQPGLNQPRGRPFQPEPREGRPTGGQANGPNRGEFRPETEVGCDLTFSDARNSTREFTAEAGTNVERDLKDFVSQAQFYEAQLKRSHRRDYVNYLVASKVIGRARELLGPVSCETVAQLKERLEKACTIKVGPHNLIRRMMSCHQGTRPMRQFIEELRDIEQRLKEEQPERATDYRQMMLGVLMSNSAEKYANRLVTVMPRSWEEAVDYLEKVAMAEPKEDSVLGATTEEVQVTFAEETRDTQGREGGRYERHPNASTSRGRSFDRSGGDRDRRDDGRESYRSWRGDRSRDASRTRYRKDDREQRQSREPSRGRDRDRWRSRDRENQSREPSRGRENRWRSRDREDRSASRGRFRERSRTSSRGRDDYRDRRSLTQQIQELEKMMKKALSTKKTRAPKNGARTSTSVSEEEE